MSQNFKWKICQILQRGSANLGSTDSDHFYESTQSFVVCMPPKYTEYCLYEPHISVCELML